MYSRKSNIFTILFVFTKGKENDKFHDKIVQKHVQINERKHNIPEKLKYTEEKRHFAVHVIIFDCKLNSIKSKEQRKS